jgi:NodT family efflux transporter outer membrane factor (OMF) lipoprotein
MKPIASICLSLTIAALLVACTVGRNYQRPELPPSSSYSAAAPITGLPQSLQYGADIADDWYTLFRSDALNQLVRAALAENPDLNGARHSLIAAQYELTAVAGTALPQIDATGGFTRTHSGSVSAGSTPGLPPGAIDHFGNSGAFSWTSNQMSIGPTLSYPLDVFGGLRRSIEAQAATTAATRDQALNTYITLVNQVVVNAFDYAASQAQVDATKDLIRDLQAQVDLSQRLESAGKISRSDVLTAQSQLESTAATLPSLEKQHATYRNALAQLVGKTPGEFTPPALILRDFTLPAEVPVSLPSDLVQQRPDILAAQDALHQASAAIGVAQAARLPSLSLTAQMSQQAGKLSQLFTQGANGWSAGLNLAAPLFSAGSLKARSEEAKERYLEAVATYRTTILAAFADVGNALQAIQFDTASYDAYTRSLKTAAANRDLAEQQYRAGKYNELRVLTAQQQYRSAVLSQVQADAQRFTDTASLIRALGGGWWNAPQDPSRLPDAAAATFPSNATRESRTAQETNHD